MACLLMGSLGYWRDPPQGALGGGAGLGARPGGEASVLLKLLGNRRFQVLRLPPDTLEADF